MRIAELKEMNQRGDRDWLFSSGFVRFLNELESGKSTWSPKTIKRYKTSLLQVGRILDEWYSDIGGDVEELLATDITTAVVAEFVSRRLEEGVDVQTINRDLTPFRHLMNSMKNHGWIEVNPIVAYERQGMKETLPDIVLPSDAAIRKLGARAPGTLAHFPAFLNETGMRVTEAAMLLRSDVRGLEDYPRSKVTVTLRATKGKKVRVITLRAAAVRIRSQIEPSALSPYVFWNNTEHGHYRDAASLFWQYREETKFGARLHDLRHKFAIERLREGWSMVVSRGWWKLYGGVISG